MIRAILSLLLLGTGGFLAVYGAYDDAPGAVLLGALGFIAGVFRIVRDIRGK